MARLVILSLDGPISPLYVQWTSVLSILKLYNLLVSKLIRNPTNRGCFRAPRVEAMGRELSHPRVSAALICLLSALFPSSQHLECEWDSELLQTSLQIALWLYWQHDSRQFKMIWIRVPVATGRYQTFSLILHPGTTFCPPSYWHTATHQGEWAWIFVR